MSAVCLVPDHLKEDTVIVLDPRRLFGQVGESEAERCLRRKGYRILERNVRSLLGEIDLIAEDGPVLVFVEVKARRTDTYGGAVEAVHRHKQERLIRLAAQYLALHHIRNRPCRFDVVLIQSMAGGLPQIDHIQNAFDVSGDDLRW